ncbi:hypothetical protein GCM10007199_35040 [Fictibacillus barbaricus]|nr:hypothetical protein GCM10007199_35040 [Fictibacillus barbaricus]
MMTIELCAYTFIMNSLTMCMDIDVKGFKFQWLGDNNSAAAFGLDRKVCTF